MRRAVLLLALAGLAGCDEPELTEILVVVDTDMGVPGEIARVRFQVQAPDGRVQEAIGDFTSARPAVLGLVHRGGPLGPFLVAAQGERGPGEIVRQRRARVSFLEGRAVVLRMDLLAACDATARCGMDETCGAGGCRSVDVSPDELTDWTGAAPGLDAGAPDVPDAGVDGGVDASFDGGVDGGPPMMCADLGTCDDGHDCTVDTCESMLCVHTPDDTACTPDAIDCTVDRCDPLFGCVSAPDHAACGDDVACTVDTCDPTTGCSSAPDDAACDDGVACTADTCDATAGCTSTPDDAACDDGIPCTADVCDAAGGCASTVDHALCPEGEYCDAAFALGCVTAPTFGDVFAILDARCSPCHTQMPFEANMSFADRATAYANLVGVTAECGGGVNTRVIPRDARTSLLWRKLAAVDLCGDPMPRRGVRLPDADIARIEQWINAGAPDN